ncbi:pyruvate kinase [Candidatus Uabimicrobium sp. HlEnr_7]|uniref:pyruvate kinase n=1 Tax=Candidatus Uabimicrobium helgolandensis TaxID=3095367 RepID=UPI0035581E00
MFEYNTIPILKLRRTKIVATIGLSSCTEKTLKDLVLQGVNVCRLNFSHGTHESHLNIINNIRKVKKETGKDVAILGDLCGPKIRVGQFVPNKFGKQEVFLEADEEVLVVTDNVMGGKGVIPSQYSLLIQDIKIGQYILLDDGNLELQVIAINSDTCATCRVVRGGILKNNKGMNIPGSALSVPALTAKDIRDLKFCIKQEVDYIALSFVRRADEIIDLRNKIVTFSQEIFSGEELKRSLEHPIHIIAKIEKPEALDDMKQIVEATDGVMVARGDLGVELVPQKVPIVQKELIELANEKNKPVIVATQMLESMITNARPTRAEVSDVANAAFDNADAVMLSGETAAGRYPLESVKVMDAVLREVEYYKWSHKQLGRLELDEKIYELPDALSRACTLLSQDLLAIRALNVFTLSAYGPRLLSSLRPNAPIFAYCTDKRVVNQMSLYWGVKPILLENVVNVSEFIEISIETVKRAKVAKEGEQIIVVSPVSDSGNKNYHSISVCDVK